MEAAVSSKATKGSDVTSVPMVADFGDVLASVCGFIGAAGVATGDV